MTVLSQEADQSEGNGSHHSNKPFWNRLHTMKDAQEQQQKDDAIPPDVTLESVYEFYKDQLMPALMTSIPILCHRLIQDVSTALLPSSSFSQRELQEKAASLVEFVTTHVQDLRGAGQQDDDLTRLATEFVVQQQQQEQSQFDYSWWMMMDHWNVGMWVYRSCGGLLVVMVLILSMVPGRLHRVTGQCLRWPVLGVVYLLIFVELIVYMIIRIGIRIAEIIICTPKHRALRKLMADATSYPEWYQRASLLDVSQQRDVWQKSSKSSHHHSANNSNSSSSRYNWSLIRQLSVDLQQARRKGDALQALAVLQQCTRKNVGGIMSEDLFSVTNTGQPKHVVTEFIDQVSDTLHWMTDQAVLLASMEHDGEDVVRRVSSSASHQDEEEDPYFVLLKPPPAVTRRTGHHLDAPNNTPEAQRRKYEQKLSAKSKQEKVKLWNSVLSWATLSLSDLGGEGDNHANKKKNDAHRRSNSMGSDRSGGPSSPMSCAMSMASSTGDDLPAACHREQLVHFLKRARAAYGRTALCLSGGAMMGLYHFGHVLGLMETNCLPSIVSGTSAGSAIGALLCTRTNEELKEDWVPEEVGPRMRCFARSWPDRLKSLWKNGCLFSATEWLDMIKWFTSGDMTFEEAYHKTGRIFCITLCSTTKKAPPVLLNYMTAPHVTIASAVIASAAVPGFVQPVRLQVKDHSTGTVTWAGEETYFDGSIESDIPTNGLAEQLNCQFFVAAQCNPHVVPFFFNATGGVGAPNRWSSGGEQGAASSWRGGFLLAALEMYLKNDMKAKFVFLHDLEAAVGFTSSMMVQNFLGSTTIVPDVQLWDFFTLFKDPEVKSLGRKFRVGAVASYQHAAMIQHHYQLADTLDQCLEKLGANGDRSSNVVQPSRRGAFAADARNTSKAGRSSPKRTRTTTISSPGLISAALRKGLER